MAIYNLPVTARDLREIWRERGLAGLRERAHAVGAQGLHVRLGLARAFDDWPERCYLMMNGIYGARGPGHDA